MTEDPPIHLRRPGADAMGPHLGGDAVDLGDGIWMREGLSNSYLLQTDDGRIVVNTGMGFEAPSHRSAFDAVDPAPTRAIILTQGHPDHVGGVDVFREPHTEVIAHRDFGRYQGEFELLEQFRSRNSAFAFIDAILAAMAHADRGGERGLPAQSRPRPTLVVDDELELVIGGRRLVLVSVPGGETLDSLVVWLPAERTALVGNTFGPLFGHVPNLVTIRGDRYRDSIQYIEAIERVRALAPMRLITGHFDPIDGAELIDDTLRRMGEAARWVHDRTVEGMNAGKDVHTLMREVVLPPELAVGEGYGKVAWNVKAIRDTYAGWFHHRSTTELYDVAPSAVAPDIIAAAGADALVAAADARLAAGEAVAALHLTDLVLAAEPDHPGARLAALEAHLALHRATEAQPTPNFWERAWLRRKIHQLGGELA
jgi:alkyl sulfatase BDS1-like metallo-beta-lactamase superfamily hydrolase